MSIETNLKVSSGLTKSRFAPVLKHEKVSNFILAIKDA